MGFVSCKLGPFAEGKIISEGRNINMDVMINELRGILSASLFLFIWSLSVLFAHSSETSNISNNWVVDSS